MVSRAGFRGNKRVANTGLAGRADRRLQDIVGRYQQHYETALAVDGVVAFVWNKAKGTNPCTCRGVSLRSRYDTSKALKGGVEKGDQTVKDNNTFYERKQEQTLNNENQFVFVGENITRQKRGGALTPNSVSQTLKEKIEQPAAKTIEYLQTTGDYNEPVDILQALGEDEFPDEDLDDPAFGAQTYTNKPMGTTPMTVMCPICLGMGTTDSWNLYGGQRIILDYSNRYPLMLDTAEVDNAQPVNFTVYSDSDLTWQNVEIPALWASLLKLVVYNRGKVVNPDQYSLYYIHPSAPMTKNPLTFNTLASMNGNMLLNTSNRLVIGMHSVKDSLQFTHIEILFQLGDLVKIQVPDMEIGDDAEFADWNLTATFETSANVEIRESSYVVESKYKRVWKVSSINKKLTATGKSFGYTINGRALHPQEKPYTLLNIVGKPIDPFTTMVDELLEDYDF